MRIITWNCNMAFRNKAHLISAYKPDILVVPECEHPEKLKFREPGGAPSGLAWFGENPNKGLGIFSYTGFRFDIMKLHNPDFKMIVPIAASNGILNITLFAIWANNPNDKDGQYVTQTWKAVHHYQALLKNESVILAGDFNSNSIWDRPGRIGNHSDLVNKLAESNIHSTYHHHFKQTQGQEPHPTHYLYRHQDKPFHLDYCFVSGDMLRHLQSVEVGDFSFWSEYSDHVPVISTFSKKLIRKTAKKGAPLPSKKFPQ